MKNVVSILNNGPLLWESFEIRRSAASLESTPDENGKCGYLWEERKMMNWIVTTVDRNLRILLVSLISATDPTISQQIGHTNLVCEEMNDGSPCFYIHEWSREGVSFNFCQQSVLFPSSSAKTTSSSASIYLSSSFGERNITVLVKNQTVFTLVVNEPTLE